MGTIHDPHSAFSDLVVHNKGLAAIERAVRETTPASTDDLHDRFHRVHLYAAACFASVDDQHAVDGHLCRILDDNMEVSS